MAGIVIGVDSAAAFTNVKSLTKALDELGAQGIVTESEIKKLSAELQKKLDAEAAERKAAALGTTLDRVAKSCGMTAGQLAELRTKAGLAASSMSDLNKSITLVHSSSVQSAGSLASSGASADLLVGKIELLAAGYLSLQSAMQAIQGIATMESLKASFNGIFGDKGAEQFKYVADAANKYGKSIEETAGSYRKFAAAADYVGMSTESIRKIFEGTSQAITKVGGSSQDVSGALLAISQSIGKGKVMSEEFRQQFAERIPVAMELASRAMGVTSGEFQKMMEAGQVLPTEFWPKMADEMAKFSQGWQQSSQTLVSDFERMKNALMQLGGNDVVQSITKVLGFFTMGTVEESAKRITSIFDDFTTKYRAIKAEASGELSPFEAWITPIDDLKKRLDDIAAKRSEYITGMKTEIEGLTKSLADAQSKQLDFGPSGESVDVMRQKLKWFQDLLLQLTGQTHVVNVTANVDTSQLKQAQSYIQEIIKGTSEVKSRTIAAESEKLDNAVKVLGKSKADLETKLSNPNADLREKGGVAQQIEAINKDLDDAKLGYTELQKQQKQLTERQIKDASEVKKFNDSRGGVSGSEVTHDTQRLDAERLSVARQTDAWREYQAGLKTLPEVYETVSRAQEAEVVTQGKITKAIANEAKARTSGANAGAKYAERTSSYLEQAQDQYEQLVAQMGGDSLGAKIAGIEKRYDKAASAIRQAMIGAKGSTAELDATLAKMAQSKDIEILIAQADAWKKSMQDAANLMGELGRLSGDPEAAYGSTMTTAKIWEADQQKRIDAIENLDERAKQSAELQRVMALKEVAARADAYEGIKAVSSEYWNAEKQLIEANLATVKAHAEDETAYKIYEAQRWDEFYKAQMESQAAYAGTFAETLSAKWSLAFGGYKSETTKTKESWDQMSDSIIQSADGMVDSIAGGFGDMIRNIGNGTASIEDLWKNMLSRMLDMFASFVEQLIKQQLKNLLAGMFSGDDATNSLSSAVSSMSGIRDGGSGSTGGSILSLGKNIGKGVVSAFSSGDTDSSVFIKKLSEAATIETAAQAASPSGYTALTSGASSAGALATNTASSATSMLSTVGSVLGVVGAIGGIVGIVASLFGEKKEEVKKVASGYNVGYNAGHATSYGVDFYSDGSVTPTGASDPDVQKKIADSFRETAESLQDFAEELGFAVDVLEGFSMPSMNVTDDQLDGYIRNGENMMAFKGLMEAGLRGAFDAVARDGEVYVDEYERLATSLSTVRGGLESYGYELSDVAMITQENIDALRVKNTEVAEGTAAAMTAMATSMGATSDVLSQITSESTHAAAAMSVTDEQLSSILEADYASDLLDAIGGEDAFNTMMGNLTKNIFDTIGAYAENLDYYTNKATSAISKLDEAGVTVDNFWEKFDAAIKQGLTVDEFEAWSKASTWVNQIDTVTQAMEDWADGMERMGQSLDVRKLKALGQDDAASMLNTIYTQEQELAQARKDGYDAAVLLQLEEVQLLELRRAEADSARKGWEVIQSLNVREKELNNDPYAEAAQSYYDNGWELKEAMESGLYSASDLARLADIQKREIQKYYDEIAESTAQNSENARARLMRAMGDDDGADLYEAQINAERELKEARDSGLYTLEAYATLSAALDQEIKNLIESQKDEFVWTERELQARLLSATGHQNEATVLTNLIAAEKELAEAREAGYDAATIMLLEIVQAAEAAKVAADQMSQSIADLADLKSREYAATGDDTMSSWTALLEQQRQERYDALSNGKDQDYMRELMRVQGLERTSEWEDLQEAEYQEMLSEWRESQQEAIDAMNDQLDDLTDSLGDLKDALSDAVDSLNEAMDSINDIISVMLSNANSIYSRAASTSDAIRGNIDDIMNGQESILSPSQKSASLKGQIDTAYEQMTTAGHGAARVEAASTISGLASEYLSALQSSTDSEKYMTEYLEMMTKLREAESISGLEENYQARIVDALEEEQRILNLIRTELAKDDPNTAKLQALAAASGVMGTALQDIYGDTESAGSWRDSVEGLLASAGYSNADIIAALGGNVGSQSFLAQLSDFNSRVLGTQLPFISKTIGEIKGIEESIQRLTEEIAEMQDQEEPTPPPIDPEPGDQYTAQQIAWATNLQSGMNSQAYGGSTSWSVDDILPNLDFYKQWGSAYNISDTQGFSIPTSAFGQYYYAKTKDLNLDGANGKDDWKWNEAKQAIGAAYGFTGSEANTLAHWINAGYTEGYSYPAASDPVGYKTAQYFIKKWSQMTDGRGDNPLDLARIIAGIMSLPFSNSTASLESIARTHYDTYLKNIPNSQRSPSDVGLVQPYALGGTASAGSWGLVGEAGPEIVRFGAQTQITSTNASKNLLGDAFADVVSELRAMRKELYAVGRETAKNTLTTSKIVDRFEVEGIKVKEATA